MEPSESERFDGVLLNVAQQGGSIDNILDIFFGFLQRKTDFFIGAQDEDSAKKLVDKQFKKHWKQGQKRREEEKEKNRAADDDRKRRADEKKAKDEAEYAAKQAEIASKAEAEPKIEEITDEEAARIKDEKKGKKGKKEKEEKGKEGEGEKEEEKEDKEDKEGEGEKEEEDDKEPPPLGNGGTTDKYTWTQTLATLELMVAVRPGVKAKQITCDIQGDSMKVGVKGEALIMEGKLHSKVKPDDCMWTLIDNKIVQISLEKFDNMKWWSCVMAGDAEIDTKKVVPENSKLSDLDGETRQTVEKMMYDQRQKQLGKPTSDQEKQHDLLSKFMAAHPEMDFSKAKVNYGGSGGGGFG